MSYFCGRKIAIVARGIAAEHRAGETREGDGADSPTRAKQVKPEGQNARSEAARPNHSFYKFC
jgi:hypothetical protein